MALEGLDKVDWSSLTHAYGPATTTANELRTLLTDDDRQRSEALASLAASICHQGSVYPATAPAVPFLVEIATTSMVPSAFQVEVVQFLEFIAQGAVDLGRYHPDWAAEDWAKTLTSNLRASAPSLLALLRESDNPLLRAWIVWFIHSLPPSALELDVLRNVIHEERDEVVKATIALTLSPEDPLQADLVSPRERPIVRLAAAAQLISTGRDLDRLVTIATESVPQCARFSEMPIRSEDTSPVRLIASRLGAVSPARQQAWITSWLPDQDQCVEALYAAWGASETRRSSARALVDPVTQALLRPPLATKEFLFTAALTLTMLGLPGVNRLRELASSATRNTLEQVRFHLTKADDEISSVRFDLPIITPQRRPEDLAALLRNVRPHDMFGLEGVRALNELAAWGHAASDQKQNVDRLLDETNSVIVRIYGARALARITDNAERSVSVLIREFERHPEQGAMIARFLAGMGPYAAPALATLQNYVDSDIRPRDMSPLRDDLVATACVEAISRIQSPS